VEGAFWRRTNQVGGNGALDLDEADNSNSEEG
jgi:hypothetical protein